VNLSVAALSRGGRTPPGAVEIGPAALGGTAGALVGVDAIAPSGELIEAERQAGRVAVAARAARAWAQGAGAGMVVSTASKQGRGTSVEWRGKKHRILIVRGCHTHHEDLFIKRLKIEYAWALENLPSPLFAKEG
jgi:hypothetical protein